MAGLRSFGKLPLERYRKAFATFPRQVQGQARSAYQLFRLDPNHSSIRFKQGHPRCPIYSARVGLGYRALAVREGETVIWFWIGSHAEYDNLLTRQ